MRAIALALVALAVSLGLYYDERDARAAKSARPAMPAASAPAVQHEPAPSAAPARPEVTHFRIGHRNVKSIHAEADAIWVATSDGVIRYDIKTQKHRLFDGKDGLPSSNVFFVGRVDGHVLAGTAGGHLCVFDERSRKWTSSAIPGAGAVLDVLQAKNGEVWIASLAGVTQVPAGALADPARWVPHTAASTLGGLPAQPVYGLAQGSRGEIWVATERGAARFAQGRWDNWRREGETDRVVAIKVDARGRVWAGTWGKGLRRFDGASWKAYGGAQGLPGNYVLALFDARREGLWIGTDNGVARLKNGRLEKQIRARDGLLADKVLALAATGDGSLWVGSFGGVARLRPLDAL